MKRASILVVGLVAALCLALGLCGCSSESYTPKLKDQTVSNELLQEAGTLTVGVNSANAPFSAATNSSLVGIDVDIAAAIADEMGLKLKLVDVGTDVSGAFTTEGCDIVMGVSGSGDNYVVTSTYRQSACAVFSLDPTAAKPTKKSSIAAQSSSLSAWTITDRYGESALVETADLTEAFEDLSNGTAAYAASDSTIGAYVAHASGIDAYAVYLFEEPTTYGIAVPSSKTELLTGVATALNSVQQGGVIDVINSKWIGSQPSISTLEVLKAKKKSSKVDTGA